MHIIANSAGLLCAQDGTTNFVHGQPYVCVSIALAVDRKASTADVFLPLQCVTLQQPSGSWTALHVCKWYRMLLAALLILVLTTRICHHKAVHAQTEWRAALPNGLQVVVGIVENPILSETFTALRGRGALRNGEPISSSPESDLGSALIATEVLLLRKL